jgi:hypothetical protein
MIFIVLGCPIAMPEAQAQTPKEQAIRSSRCRSA